MKAVYYACIFSVVVILVSCGMDEPVDNHPEKNLTQNDKELITNTNDFGFEIFRSVNRDNPAVNVFISPFSISMALGMVYNGAAGTTHDAFADVMGFGGMDDLAINQSYGNICDILKKLDKNVKFGLANSIWYKQGWVFEQNFIDINKKYFDAEVNDLDFKNPLSPGIINNWVESKTNGKIKKLLEAIPDEMVMYLINTIYFNAPWKYKFDKTKTSADVFVNTRFIRVNCNMMNDYRDFDYFNNGIIQAASLPYGNGSFRMLFIMPLYSPIDEFIESLGYQEFLDIAGKLKSTRANMYFPRFKMEFEQKLNENLGNLGLEIAFKPEAADFTRMYKGPEKLYISEVKHKSYIDVNEDGTEAAAATSIGMGTTSMPTSIKFNSPFVYVIQDTKTNLVLFIGKMEKPE